MNDWSVMQLRGMAGIAMDTINRLCPETASRALQETLPTADKPVRMLTCAKRSRVSFAGTARRVLRINDT